MPATLPFRGLSPLCRDLEELANDLHKLRLGKQPSAEALKAAPLLDGWSFGFLPAPCLTGAVYQHPTLGVRQHICTSELVLIDPRKKWARTWSTFYRLGKQATPHVDNA
jgi:hypothetical protein